MKPVEATFKPLEYSAESRHRTGSQHDIQCSEPAAVARGQKCRAGVKSLRTAGYAQCPESCSLAMRLWRLLNRATPYIAAAGHSPSSAMGRTAVPPTRYHPTSVSPRALSTLSFRRRVFAENPHYGRGFPVPQTAPRKALGAEKPAAKRPRSYMEGPCGRKLSIMSTVLPNTPSQKSKEQMLSFLGGT